MSLERPAVKFLPLEIRVRKTISKFRMLEPNDRVAVAASGGADSTALLLCLHRLAPELRISIAAVHLNHHIRGAEADADEEFVRRMSSGFDIPFVTGTIEVKKQAAETRENLEQFARRTRYNFLCQTASRLNAQKIAVGHTLNDQAETILFRLIRGSGLQGLSAIHPAVGGLVIRPLLECTRDEIIEYLKQSNAPYREDSTNKDLCHTRNRIRRELLPCLEKNYNPRIIPTLGRTAGLLREAWTFVESEAGRVFEDVHQTVAGGISLRVGEIEKLHPALQKQVLRHALKFCFGSLCGITSQHVESLLLLCSKEKSGTKVPLPRRGIAIRQFDKLVLMNRERSAGQGFSYTLDIPGQCFIPEIEAVFSAGLCDMPLEIRKRSCSNRAFLEPSVLPRMLTIRSRAPGDRYGGPGHRKIKKMLIDRKIPSDRRLLQPMVVAGRNVIWIPGFSPARAYEAKAGTDSCIIVKFETKDSLKA